MSSIAASSCTEKLKERNSIKIPLRRTREHVYDSYIVGTGTSTSTYTYII